MMGLHHPFENLRFFRGMRAESFRIPRHTGSVRAFHPAIDQSDGGVYMDFRSGEKTRDGYLALPPSGAGPGVLVLHAWWGLNEFFVGLCDRLAREGYVALAPDLYEGAVTFSVGE